MSEMSIKELLGQWLTEAKSEYVKDLESMSHDQLLYQPTPSARTPYDFTYEVVVVNRRIAARLRGEDPGKWPYESFVLAPGEFQNQATAIAEFSASMDEVASALEAFGENDLDREIQLSEGTTTPISLAHMCSAHASYHDAQLNYIQSTYGDLKVHW
jgi:hypothetical protein